MYNEEFIELFDEYIYQNYLNDMDKLDYLMEQYIKRYTDDNVDGELLAFKESLDHYILKKISENRDYVKTKSFSNYYKFISKIYYYIPTELVTNPVFRYRSVVETACNLYETDKNVFPIYARNVKAMNNKVDCLNDRIKNNELLTQSDLDFLCRYYAGRRNYDDNFSNLITYIYTYLGKRTGLKCSYEVLDAINTYLPFEYNPQELDEVSINSKFNPRNVRIVFTDIHNGKMWDSPGCSCGNKPIVFMNRKMFKNIDFDSINDSSKAYLKRGSDFTFMMIVAFHELTHQMQFTKAMAQNLTEEGVMYSIHSLINGELCDYKKNHDNDDIEIDATKVGWDVCRSFYHSHYKKNDIERLSRNCYINGHTTRTRYGTAIKEFKNGKIMEKDVYDVSVLSQLVSKKPEILCIFPCLKKIYNEDGSINQNVIYDSNFGSKIYGKKYMLYFLRNKMFDNIDFSKVSDFNLSHLFENIYQAVNNGYSVMELMNYTNRHDSDGEQKKVVDDEKVKNMILKNMFEDFYSAREFYRKYYNNNKKFGSTLHYYADSLKNNILKLFSSSVKLTNGMAELPSDEQIDILNRVIKKAREIGVSEECIDFFDRRRKKLVEDENATIRTNNI